MVHQRDVRFTELNWCLTVVWLNWQWRVGYWIWTCCAVGLKRLVAHCRLTEATGFANRMCDLQSYIGASLWSDWTDSDVVLATELEHAVRYNFRVWCLWLLKWQGSPTGCAIYRVKLVSHCGLTGLTMTCWLTNWLDLLCDGITQSGVSLSSVVWLK